MSTYQLSCTIGTTDPTAELGLEIWIDNEKLFNSEHINQTAIPLSFNLKEHEGEHELRFVMKNKKINHTLINEAGDIVKDASLLISNVNFDEIELKQTFIDNATYIHDFNGTKEEIVDKFYGTMGCNGSVTLKYTTPVYLWLLEKM